MKLLISYKYGQSATNFRKIMQLTLLVLSVQRIPTRNLRNPPSPLWSSDISGAVTDICEFSDQYAESVSIVAIKVASLER